LARTICESSRWTGVVLGAGCSGEPEDLVDVLIWLC
jgi:hypothetical protein